MTTSKGGSGLVPVNAGVGDALCFFAGSGTPFVIRATGEGEWAIVGIAREYFLSLLLYCPIMRLTIVLDFHDVIALHSVGLGVEPSMITLV